MATEARVDMIECNFSCPQTTLEHTGSDVGTNPQLVAEYLKATRKGTSLPIIAKMTPNITNMNIIAKVAMQSGANAISAINTVKSIINLDLNDFTTLPDINGKSSVSGMSGRAIKPIALRFQYEMYNDPQLKALKTEYSGVGGIDDAKDVMEYILLGASCVQVCTSVMERGYTIIEKLLTDLAGLVGANQIKDLIGKACPNIVSPKELDRATKCIFKIGNECKRCDRCFTSCNDGGHQAIVKTANDYKIDTTKCVGCGLCSLVCPNRNIKMIERVKK
ncbi:hypothetical protein FACS1894166_04250 [Bacilli bacterium]|nr:hypothetical protein FACS1894166_04250 [Bacilli bacterium]